ncbi:hypothetical protein HID58_013379 [Brassica napus]|uniref:BnaA03g54120D protein n=3 Tax=Brassica TaxID=3705 RepID=A0A078GWM1_BRANA|nr:hypothetical protein HID58_013379 [Brassica napus]CAF2133517.1 unnamed protein product [Brassica napus]CDY29567.1 BnaA03g54120D [Brassica napus]VDC84370.1 unnamed protein product [Brassica rapa]
MHVAASKNPMHEESSGSVRGFRFLAVTKLTRALRGIKNGYSKIEKSEKVKSYGFDLLRVISHSINSDCSPIYIDPSSNNSISHSLSLTMLLDCDEMLSGHLEKQNELLKETQKTMSHELQTLMVEEEMMMHKLCELMVTHRKNKKEMKKTQETVESSVVTVEAQRPPIIYQYRRKKSKAQQKTVQVSNGSDIDKGF